MFSQPEYYLIYWPSTGNYESALAAGVYDLQRLGPEPQYDECNGVNDPSPGPDNGDEAAIGSGVAPQWILLLRRYLLHRFWFHSRGVESLQSIQQHPS